MTLSRIINRSVYYLSDIPLLFRTLSTYITAYFFTADSRMIALASPQQKKASRDKDKITRYVDTCLFFGSLLGANNTCLIHSVVLCRMLRQHGLNATINFGVKKENHEKIAGHCWVDIDGVELPADWQVILSN